MSRDVHGNRETAASDEVSSDVAFKEGDVGSEVNCDGGPRVGKRELGKGDVMVFVKRERGMIKGMKEMMKGGFHFGGVGDFTFDGRSSHFDVIIRRLSGGWAGEGSLQTDIRCCRANRFINAVGRWNISRTRRVSSRHRRAGSGPSLLHTESSKGKGSDKVLRSKRDSVSAVTVIRRVSYEGDIVMEHFVYIKNDTCICSATERVWTCNREGIRGWGGEQLNC